MALMVDHQNNVTESMLSGLSMAGDRTEVGFFPDRTKGSMINIVTNEVYIYLFWSTVKSEVFTYNLKSSVMLNSISLGRLGKIIYKTERSTNGLFHNIRDVHGYIHHYIVHSL